MFTRSLRRLLAGVSLLAAAGGCAQNDATTAPVRRSLSLTGTADSATTDSATTDSTAADSTAAGSTTSDSTTAGTPTTDSTTVGSPTGSSPSDTSATGTSTPTDSTTVAPKPRLLVCPTDTTVTVTGVVGPQGGVLSTGGFRIEFPAGAVTVPQKFVLSVLRSEYLEIEAHAEGFASYQFATPVRITLDLARCGSALPSSLRAWHIDPVSNALLENMGGTLDLTGRKLRFSTRHFSGYSVAW
jgi:hypothetical protein